MGVEQEQGTASLLLVDDDQELYAMHGQQGGV